MKIVKILFGLFAAAFVVFHVVEIPKAMKVHGDFASAFWLAKGAAMLIGAAIAIKLFRSAFRTES